jgi:hypothetical protein
MIGLFSKGLGKERPFIAHERRPRANGRRLSAGPSRLRSDPARRFVFSCPVGLDTSMRGSEKDLKKNTSLSTSPPTQVSCCKAHVIRPLSRNLLQTGMDKKKAKNQKPPKMSAPAPTKTKLFGAPLPAEVPRIITASLKYLRETGLSVILCSRFSSHTDANICHLNVIFICFCDE